MAGQNITLLARFLRVKALLEGRFMKWNEINLNALNEMAPYLPPKTVRCCPYSPKPGVALFFKDSQLV